MKASIARLCLLCCLSLCLLCGCKMMRQRTSSGDENMAAQVAHMQGSPQGGAAGLAPAGTRLGAAYVSALGELCYEAAAMNGPGGQAQAICRRDGSWTLLPSIYAGAPQSQPAAFSQVPADLAYPATVSSSSKRPASKRGKRPAAASSAY